MRLSPLDPSMSLWEHGIALAHFSAGRDREAVLWATKSLRHMGQDIPNTLCVLAASNAYQGKFEEAHDAITRLGRVKPDWRVSFLPDLNAFRREEDRERLLTGLRLAGLSE
jgi:hypothetical protein